MNTDHWSPVWGCHSGSGKQHQHPLVLHAHYAPQDHDDREACLPGRKVGAKKISLPLIFPIITLRQNSPFDVYISCLQSAITKIIFFSRRFLANKY
jgi:hypothetical protein